MRSSGAQGPSRVLTCLLRRLLLLHSSPELGDEILGVDVTLLPDGQRSLHRPVDLGVIHSTVGVRERGLQRRKGDWGEMRRHRCHTITKSRSIVISPVVPVKGTRADIEHFSWRLISSGPLNQNYEH